MRLTETAERTRFAIYTHLAASGALPSHGRLARQLGITADDFAAALTELAATRNVVLKAR